MNEKQLAQKLQETGEYNAYSALLRVNKTRTKEQQLNKKQFYDALRRAYLLKTGYTKKPFDDIHNQPYPCWIKQGLARTETSTANKKNSHEKITYHVPAFSEDGMREIEKILNDSNYSLLPLKLSLEKKEKQQDQPEPTELEKEQQRQASEAARQQFFNLDKLLG